MLTLTTERSTAPYLSVVNQKSHGATDLRGSVGKRPRGRRVMFCGKAVPYPARPPDLRSPRSCGETAPLLRNQLSHSPTTTQYPPVFTFCRYPFQLTHRILFVSEIGSLITQGDVWHGRQSTRRRGRPCVVVRCHRVTPVYHYTAG